MWENAFVAASVAFGERLEDARAALGDEKNAAVLLAALGSQDKRERAKALAAAVAAIAFDLERAEVTWAP